MRNSRPKKRPRRQQRSSISGDDDSDSSFTVATPATNSRKNRRQTAAEVDFAEENSNDSASAEYRTRSGRKSSYRVGITIARTVPKKKKIGRPRKLDIYRSEDEDEEDEVVDYGHHFEEEEEEEEVRLSEEDSPNENEVEEEEEEEVEEDVSDEILSKKRLRSAREAPATLFMDNVEVPELTLPPSSEDLLIKGRNLMRTISIYEILRRFQQNLRLTPFRFEDFCVSLLIDEQTYLLSEIHIQLLKALIREDDLAGTQHGPQDVRDAINIYLYLCDPMTWPEVTRLYLSTDYKKNAKLFNDSLAVNYPFASLEQKLTLLEYFCEEFLTSASCREVLNNEGTIKHDDNCRGCHRTGDLLCCDTCPAVFHLGCLDPPLRQVPEDGWTCPICRLNTVGGVTDCVGELERLGYCSRQEPVGWDRHGRKYWFLCRRLIVEDQKEDADQVVAAVAYYYSSRLQFDELLASLDAEHYESDLCEALAELKGEIYRQMTITERLTRMAKGALYRRKSYLEVVNEELFSRREGKLKLRLDEAEEEEEKAALQEQLADLEAKLAVDEVGDDRTTSNTAADGSGVLTRLKTGTIQPKTVSMDSFKNRIHSYNNFSAVRADEETVIYLKEETVSLANEGDGSNNNSQTQVSLTRRPRKTLPATFLAESLFKLGLEGNYRQYQNIYSLNKFALSKKQLEEERLKRRGLSHRFSLTPTSELKWATYSHISTALPATTVYGTRSTVVNVLRQAVLYLESQLPAMLLHPVWHQGNRRAAFTRAVAQCAEPADFAAVLQTLESAMKPVLLNGHWFEAIGFGAGIQRSVFSEREEAKKRKDRFGGGAASSALAQENMTAENELAAIAAGRSSAVALAAGVGVRLVCGKLKHQIWKQKGEEYRLSGIGGWQWVSSTRVRRPQEHSERATGKKEEEKAATEEEAMEAMEATDDGEPSAVIDISAALSDETPARGRKYSKVISSSSSKASSRLDSLLKTRLDMYAFDKRQEKEEAAAAKKAEEEQKTDKAANSGDSSTYRCYSTLCHSAGQSSQQLKCYSSLCIYQKATNSSVKEEANEAVVEQKLSPLDDTAEHVDLVEVKAVGVSTVPSPVKKIVPFKSDLLPTSRFMVGEGGGGGVKYKSMLILPLYEMRKLGRNGGLREVIGFNYVCKSNNVNWPYGHTPRPSLRLMWLWRTACLGSLHAVAHQLRVLWAAIRWDDIQEMLAKPPASSAVKTITTESEVTTVEILRRRDLPPFGLRSQYLMRKIIVPIDLPSTPSSREVSTPSRSGLRQRKRPVSPPVKGPRMEETWLNEEELELWEIRHFAERASMEERRKQIEQRAKAAAELRKSNAASTPASAKLVNGAKNSTSTSSTPISTNASPLNTKQAISSRLSSIFQNRAASRLLASTSPVINSGTITPNSSATTTTTYATIRTANGTFRVPVHNKPGAPPNQLFLRTGGQIITSSSTAGSTAVIQGGNVIVTSNAVTGTPTRPGTYIVRAPATTGAAGGVGTAKPLIISNVGPWSNGALPDIVRGGNPNIKQAVPLIEPKGPQKISTGTTVNSIQATSSSSSSSSAAKSTTTPAQSTVAAGAISTPSQTTTATTPTIGKGIQCVQLRTSDGRTHLLPISSLPTAPGQTFQIALNSGGSGTPLRLITTTSAAAAANKPGDNGKGQTTYMLSAGSSAFVPPGANGGQKVILQQQQQQPANSITSTNSTASPAIDSSYKVMVEPTTTADGSAKANLVTAPATTTLITSSSSKPAAPAPQTEPPKAFELTPEVTQEIVRKALMDASLPLGTSQKLLAYQKRHRQLNKLGGSAAPVGADGGGDGGDHDGSLSGSTSKHAKKPIGGSSGRNGGSYYSSATSRLMDSVSSSSRPSRLSSSATSSSRSSRHSRGNSRYDNSDFITDFTPASKKHLDRLFEEDEEEGGGGLEGMGMMMTGDDEFDALDQVDRVCAGVLKGLLEKVEKGEKMARRAELREERNQKLVAASRLKYRQAHIEVMRRSIERRKAQLNISIRLHVEEQLNGQFAKAEEAAAAAPKSKSAKKRKLADDADTPPTSKQVSPSKQANRGGKTPKRPKVTVISQSPPSSFPAATNGISHNDDDYYTADAAATVNGQAPKLLGQARSKTTHSKLLNGSTTSSTAPNSITTTTAASTAKLSQKFTSIRQMKKAMKAQSRVDICEIVAESSSQSSSETAAAAATAASTYCVCQQAYDAAQFYICCDRCQGWFHGRCVGVTAAEANATVDYSCPKCEGDSKVSLRNIKPLSEEDFASLKTTFKAVQSHKHAWPFLQAVNEDAVPDYFTIIKEPIDLSLIERRLEGRAYRSLAEFIYDMKKMLDNCRLYNARTSSYYHCAEALGNFFNRQLTAFRRKPL